MQDCEPSAPVLPATRPEAGDHVTLRILATSDLHANVRPFDYCADLACDSLGLVRAAQLVDSMRAGADLSILLDNGDFLLGSPFGDRIAETARPDCDHVHPVIAVMNQLRYDAVTLGNHEFNHGLPFLLASLRGATFPVVSANALAVPQPGEDDGAERRPLVPPYVILDRETTDRAGRRVSLRIGVIGFLPSQTAIWDKDILEGRIETPDILPAAQLWVPRLRALGADVVVALAHTGIGAPVAGPGNEDAATALAALPGIDVVIAGHSHQVFPSPHFAGMPEVDAVAGRLAGKPAMMPGANGAHLGVMDLTLAPGPQGWRIVDASVAVHPIAARDAAGQLVRQVESSEPLLAATARDHAATRRFMRQRVGRMPQRVTTHFSLVADGPAMRMLAAAQAAHVMPVLAGTVWEGLPVLAAAAPFKAGGRGGAENFTVIPAGPLARRHLADIYVFPNQIRALRVTGAELAEWLERAASIYRQVTPGGQDQPLLDPAFPSYEFDTIPGLSYLIDPTVKARYDARGRVIDPTARRIRALFYAGNPLDPDADFILVTNNYRIATWQPLTGDTADRLVLSQTTQVRRILGDYVSAGCLQALQAPQSWRLALPPDTTAILPTARDADTAELSASGLVAQPSGITKDGFALMRLALAKPMM